MQIAGITRKDAKKIVLLSSTRSNLPEPLRVAHLVASGLGNLELEKREKVKFTIY